MEVPRQEEWKLVELYETERTELYNLLSDPGEENNLSADYPDVVISLQQKLHDLQNETGAKFSIVNPDWSQGLE